MSIPWNACVRQGSVEAGIQWEKAAKMILMGVVPIWEEMQWGLRLDNIVLTHIMWVDGLWLFATDKVMLFKMVESITQMFQYHGLPWKPSSLGYMTTHEEGGGDMYINQDDEQMLVKYKTKMNILGATIDRYGATAAAFNHRRAAANAMFWRDKAFFCCKAIPIPERLDRYERRILKCICYSSGSWSWSHQLGMKLQKWENRILRTIVGCSRREDEPWDKWVARATKISRKWYFETCGGRMR